MANYQMLIDSEKCMNCKACVVACQQRNNVPYGLSRNWVLETPEADAPAGFRFQPGACMHCEDAPCIPACPTGATWRSEAGVVEIDPERCVGCGACIDACPYGARFRHPVKKIADKCDYCAKFDYQPACVAVCPTRCRIFGDLDDASSPVVNALRTRKAVYVLPDDGSAKPHSAYLDATTPVVFQSRRQEPGPVAAIHPISKGLAWISGIIITLISGVFVRQLLWPAHEHASDDSGKES